MGKSDFIWNEFVYGSHWGSLSASAIALTVLMILQINIHWEFLLIIYLVTQSAYTYNHYKEIEFDTLSNSPRVNHLRSYSTILPYLPWMYGSIFFVLLLYFGNITSILFGGILLLIGLLFTSKGKVLSKKIKGFKTAYASLSWCCLTVIFTAIYVSYSNILPVVFLFIIIIIRLIINLSFSDFKDMESDKQRGLVTLPMLFATKTRGLNFLHGLNMISCLIILSGILLKILPLFSIFLIFSSLYNFYYLQKGKQETTDISTLTHVFVDGESYCWPLLVFIGKVIFI
jgi:4-hydroxybenzoate polyprenyltransferase